MQVLKQHKVDLIKEMRHKFNTYLFIKYPVLHIYVCQKYVSL